jgi:NADH:ubiquinone oxidoreductase subunit B-like Fe-S oxidoreductase
LQPKNWAGGESGSAAHLGLEKRGGARILPSMAMLQPVAYDSKVEGNVIFTTMDAAMNWMRKNSLWPMPMGLACCAIELMAAASARFDISRFGAEVMRFSPPAK